MKSAFRSLPVPVLLFLATFAGLAAARDSAEAAGFHVNVTYDAVDANPGDFVCETAPANGECTLRAAVMEANALPGADLVTLGEGEYQLSIADDFLVGDEDAGEVGDIDILDDLEIEGSGSESSVVLGGFSSTLDVFDDAEVGIRNLALADGRANGPGIGTCGVGLRNKGVVLAENIAISGNQGRGPGGICNQGTLHISDSVISGNNTTLAGNGGGLWNSGDAVLIRVTVAENRTSFSGGGIYNSGEMTLIDSTVSDNYTAGFEEGGGGINNAGTLIAFNTTISGNTAASGLSAISHGGGIQNSGTASLTNVTVTNNVTDAAALSSGIRNDGTLTLTNTIVGNNEGGDCVGSVTSGGHNLDSDGSCGLTGTGDLSAIDPLLGDLADNGGPTMTHALLEGSPAIDTGDDAACPATDQRGAPRPADGDGNTVAVCDIGAYEAAAEPPTPTPTETPVVTPSKRGDIDCDDDVDSADGLALLRFLAGIGWRINDCPPPAAIAQTADSPSPPSSTPTPPVHLERGDINCDGRVDAVDALALLRFVAGLPVALPPGCGALG